MKKVNIKLDCGGFLGVLTLIFITLKLCNVIEWSWIWVLSPLWIPLAIAVFILVFIGVIVLWRSFID